MKFLWCLLINCAFLMLAVRAEPTPRSFDEHRLVIPFDEYKAWIASLSEKELSELLQKSRDRNIERWKKVEAQHIKLTEITVRPVQSEDLNQFLRVLAAARKSRAEFLSRLLTDDPHQRQLAINKWNEEEGRVFEAELQLALVKFERSYKKPLSVHPLPNIPRNAENDLREFLEARHFLNLRDLDQHEKLSAGLEAKRRALINMGDRLASKKIPNTENQK